MIGKRDNRELLDGALETLNDLMGEIHAGRMIGLLAENQPEIFNTKHILYVMRVAEGAIAMALRKFDDLWREQISRALLAADPPNEGAILSEEINDRGLRTFANRMVAHYAPNRADPKLSEAGRAELLNRSGFETSREFFEWTSGAIERIEAVRERLKAFRQT